MHHAEQDENLFLDDKTNNSHNGGGQIIAHSKVRHDRDGHVMKRDILGEHKSYDHYLA